MSSPAFRSDVTKLPEGSTSGRRMTSLQGDAQTAIAAGFSVDEVIWMLDLGEPGSVVDGQDSRACIPRRTKVSGPT